MYKLFLECLKMNEFSSNMTENVRILFDDDWKCENSFGGCLQMCEFLFGGCLQMCEFFAGVFENVRIFLGVFTNVQIFY